MFDSGLHFDPYALSGFGSCVSLSGPFGTIWTVALGSSGDGVGLAASLADVLAPEGALWAGRPVGAAALKFNALLALGAPKLARMGEEGAAALGTFALSSRQFMVLDVATWATRLPFAFGLEDLTAEPADAIGPVRSSWIP